jgi:hypothetical protein
MIPSACASRALAPFALRGVRKGLREVRGKEKKERRTQGGAGKDMEKNELEELRDRVPCAAVLEKAGFAIDMKESTRRAIKYRRGTEIVIVIHEGRGWFDPLSDAKGDVFNLVEHLDRVRFVEALDRVASLVGFVPKAPAWQRPDRSSDPVATLPVRWSRRRKPWPGSMTWRYLRSERSLPDAVVRAAIRHDLLREGPRGSMWAAHSDGEGIVTGWEERGPEWRGFSTGGAKVLFRFGSFHALRLCVTEAAIDAMSLAVLERVRPDSLYLSTGGGWSPATDAAIRALAARDGAVLVAATDNNAQGDRYADRLERDAAEIGCAFARVRPGTIDWNADLNARLAEQGEGMKEGRETRLPHARRPRQG